MTVPSASRGQPAGPAATAAFEATVVVCVWDIGASQLEACLAGLAAQTPPGVAGLFEVIVVDNNCGDPVRQVVVARAARMPPPVRVVVETRQGLSHARNAGIAAARGEAVLFLDDDAIPCEGWVAAYLDFFRSHPAVLCAGGPTVFDETFYPELPARHRLLLRAIGGNNVRYREARPLPLMRHAGGGNLAVRRDAFARYGLFNAEFGRRGAKLAAEEDTDLVRRLAQDGHRCYFVPAALVRHRPHWAAWSSERLLDRARRAGRSQGQLLREHGCGLPRARLYAAAALRYCLSWVRRVAAVDPAVRLLHTYRLAELGGVLGSRKP